MSKCYKNVKNRHGILLFMNDLIVGLLTRRGIFDPLEQEEFLNPDYKKLHDPFLMNDLENACVRIFQAIENKEKIAIYGDYDCDGIPGSVVLLELFKKIGYEHVVVYIPDRHLEGYGLNNESINALSSQCVQLLVTVDLGISNAPEVAHACSLGMEVIVTDHHEPPEHVPTGALLVHPKIGSYPDPNLAGAGVAFKIVQGFLKKYGDYFSVTEGWEKWLLDLVGFATLSDMVPLRGENRILSFFGMHVLRRNNRVSFQEIFRELAINPRDATEDDIYFSIAPRLNAASRMESPRIAFDLLATDDQIEARMLASRLGKINDERKSLVAHIMKDVHSTLEKRDDKPVIVIGNPGWRVGVLGLIASRIVDTYARPAFVWGREGSEVIKGSTRSDGTIHVVELMHRTKDVFLEYGGHEGAGGFSISPESIHILEERLCAEHIPNGKESGKQVCVDAEIKLSDVSYSFYESIQRLAPFGAENPKPVFSFSHVTVTDVHQFGKEKNHVEVTFSSGNKTIKGIKFFASASNFSHVPVVGDSVVCIGCVELSTFRGRRELRLRIEDITSSEETNQ